MTINPNPEHEEPKRNRLDYLEETRPTSDSVDISNDPDYQKLLELYEKGKFNLSVMVLDKLESRYPRHTELKKMRDDLELRMSAQNIAVKMEKGEKKEKRTVTLKMSVFAVVGTLVVMIAFFFSYFFFFRETTSEQAVVENTQLTSLNNQAEQLLNIGRPQTAAEIIERIREIDPQYENLPSLTERAEVMLALEAKYQLALDLVEEGNTAEALILFKEIEAEEPGMWDVGQQIKLIEADAQIDAFLAQGNAAYQAGHWAEVIMAYESALALDPNLSDPLMKEQLLNSYLNRIISMLQNEDTTVEDIESAEGYYRKAVALVPQSQEFASEREDLQEVSSDLLALKFTQVAREYLRDKDQTRNSIAQAVSYLRRASNIKPENTNLQLELESAETYQSGFRNFVDKDWVQSIENLEVVTSDNQNFAGGNAKILLFEAYVALGKQYYASSLFQDALGYFEQAELQTWEDEDNLMKLFQVQVLIGDTLEKLQEYENAVSYYDYALNAIGAADKLVDFPALEDNYAEAVSLAEDETYEGAILAFQEVIDGIDVIYSISEAVIGDGVCLALFAAENLSTMDAIIGANDLPQDPVITFGQNLNVPVIEN